jgi:hypothetical protein
MTPNAQWTMICAALVAFKGEYQSHAFMYMNCPSQPLQNYINLRGSLT